MHSLPTSEFGPTVQALAAEQLAKFYGNLDEESHADAWPGVEVKHHLIGVLDIVDGGIPRVQLNYTHVDQSQKARKVVDS